MLSKSSTSRLILRKANSSKKRTLHFPTTDVLRELRVSKCKAALLDAARMVIETNVTRDRAMDWFDDLLVATAVEAVSDIHVAALLLNVPDSLVRKRWNGLKS